MEKGSKDSKYITKWITDFKTATTNTELYRPQRITPREGQTPDEAAMEYMELVDQWIEGPAEKADDLSITSDKELWIQLIAEAKELRQKMGELTGKRVCKASDCLKYIPQDRKALYCPGGNCRQKEKSRRYREKDPKGHMKSVLKYLKDLEQEGDLDD